jgi:LCP family protein required for cell wall assembly
MPGNKHKYIFLTAFAIIIIAALAAFRVVAKRWDQPLSRGLELPTFSPRQTTTEIPQIALNTGLQSTQTPSPTAPSKQESMATSTKTPLPSVQPTPEPLCGGPPMLTVLGIGVDTEDNYYYYGLADVIRVIRVDFITPKVTVLSLPRDLWVEIPEISNHYGITHGKLNQSYFFGSEGMGYYEGPGQGPGLLTLTLAHNFNLSVDRYATINMATMAKFINAVGGITITLEKDVDGRSKDGLVDLGYFKAGRQQMDGEDVIRFSRIRMLDSDLHRINRQTQILLALQEKILNPSILTRIPDIISALQGSVITNLSPKEIAALTCLVPQITGDKLIFTNIPDDLMRGKYHYDTHSRYRTWVLTGEMDTIRSIIAHFQAGSWPQE